ncbi:MAG: bifunctional 4-hydroxy-2-oxoglutarate aldolase/2-dehydro-3-deoxy-phosphogluconate aldolase [Cryobacterium sp.]|nr:bifunctional 4-hydroxy-2-oxoglutarate aldolase/2-dehydro-3-deoxy-phosphogluconate aldolase [Cryobacterium sp.]
MTLTGSPLDVSPVIPVVVLDNPERAIPLARALLAGGVKIIEITLRTPSALASVAAIAGSVPEIALGVGSVLTADHIGESLAAGAEFLVSPGTNRSLLKSLAGAPVPVLPGVATISEVLTALDHGLTDLKFFPAGPAGGPRYLAAIGGPVPRVRFCPTGGVTAANFGDYLALPNVATVGGTWLTPPSLVEAEDWDAITALAAAAVATAATWWPRRGHPQ